MTARCDWSTDGGHLESVERDRFTTAPDLDRGGLARVTCELRDERGTAVVRVRLLAPDILAGGAPEDAPDAFAGPPGAPAVVYPLSGAVLARNIHQMQLAWRAEEGQRLFRVTVEGSTYRQHIYVGARACNGTQCSYRVSDRDWGSLAQSAAGDKVQLQMSGTAGPGQPVGRSGTLTLHFSPEDVRGGLHYFSTSRFGLMRLPFGGQRAVPFLLGKGAMDTTVDRCVGCHVVSRDGKKVAAVWAGGDGYAGIVDGADAMRFLLRPIPPQLGDPTPAPGQMWNFASFSPDGDKLVGVWKG